MNKFVIVILTLALSAISFARVNSNSGEETKCFVSYNYVPLKVTVNGVTSTDSNDWVKFCYNKEALSFYNSLDEHKLSVLIDLREVENETTKTISLKQRISRELIIVMTSSASNDEAPTAEDDDEVYSVLHPNKSRGITLLKDKIDCDIPNSCYAPQ